MKLYRLLSITLLTLSICLVSCSGEDGADGTNGIDGKNGDDGINGTNGKNGADGTDGEGFNELTQYGNVTMALKGTRPDGEGFEDSADFKFTPVTLQNENGFYNTLTITEFDNDQEYKFSLLRFLSVPDDVYQETALVFFIVINNLGDPEEEIVQVSFGINNYAVIGDDNKYFILNASNASAAELSNIAFDPVTNNLTFSYDFKFDGDFNDTGFPLEVSGEANVFVVEEVED